ncbi:far upstream element-binding protein 1-like isoform X3 [Chironomus tepperi]|uniref:far upstream element-binding protein 1-like isoform X3 n=1 Tax=Chironomus tepperi TaxID=113505 RepID=UPI00391F7438
MSDFSSNYNNGQSLALQKARQVAAKLQLAGPNKRPHDDDDEPHSKRFNSGSNSSMSPAHLQQAQQAAAQVAARLGQPNYQQNSQAGGPSNLSSSLGGNGGIGGNGSGNGPARPGLGANSYTEMMIPGSKVGLIIGKGGLTIKQLQERTGAKMVVIQDGPDQEMEKPLRISGDPQKVEHAKQLVYELIQDKGNDQSPQSNNRNQNQNSMQDHGAAYPGAGGRGNNGGGDQIEVFVPKAAVGVVIGKEGGMIKKIQADTGCKLQFLQTKGDGPGDRRCIVQGTKQQVDDGKRMIEDLIDSVLRRNNNTGGGNDNWNNSGSGSNYQQQQQHQQSQPPAAGGIQVIQQQYEFNVPTSKCGIIIGRGGDTIKQINQQSGAHCEMDRKKSANQTNEKTFTVKGEQHQIEEAKRLIQDKINMDIDLQHLGSTTVTQPANGFNGQNSQSPYQWGAAVGGYNQSSWDPSQAAQMPGGPQGINAPSGQPDYSLQWIEYYRSMGMHQQADAIESQVKTRPQSGPAIPGANPPQPQTPSSGAGGASSDSQRDYSREWAMYYRQIGRVEEAEAIERQIKGGGSSAPSSGSATNFPAPTAGNFQQQFQQQPQQPQQYGQQYGANFQQFQQYHGNGQNSSNNDKNW